MASSLDEEQLVDSVECTDAANAQALLCIPGHKALEDGPTYVVYRGLSTPAELPRVMMRTFSTEDEVAPVVHAPVKEVNDVKTYEESLIYQPHSLHKVWILCIQYDVMWLRICATLYNTRIARVVSIHAKSGYCLIVYGAQPGILTDQCLYHCDIIVQ